MNRIINPAQVKSAVVKIGYKKANGTAFFIDSNILVTAYHLFLDSFIEEESIKIYLDGESEKKCNILYKDEENDICLLTCDVNHQTFLPLTEFPIRINENWESFGYPYQDEQQGLRFFGAVHQMVEDEKYDFILNSSNIESEYDYEGMSGSPVLSAGRVVGIILKQLDNKLGAISINKISKLFNDHSIKVYEEELINEIPRQLEEDISDIISNYDVIGSLDKVIHNGGNWILLEGNPGTGKTVTVAAYTADEKCVVLGKYFTKVPNDEKPKSLRVSKEQFFNWIEETISITVTGSLPAKSGDSFEVRIEKVNGYFDVLSEYLNDIDKLGLFFIDGLDEISDLKSFLNIIPQRLPENIRFILSCTSRELLPSSIRNDIGSDRIILVSPLDLGQCEYFIQKKVKVKNIDYDSIQKIAIKSEGHPLYLHYLIDYILNSEISTDENELDIWIENIPMIGGNIENYYKTIWEDIYVDSNKLWICLILSQLRHSVPEKELTDMLPDAVRLNYYSVIYKINHLIKGKEKLEIYHNSFKDFIQKQVPLNIKNSNDLIVKFCEEHPNNLYSITNVIYHHRLSSNPQNSVASCDQDWADKLAVNHVEPDLIISDIKNVIELSIDLKMTTELLRLLLLLQRIDFRYNSILVEYAFEIALGLIANGKFENALKYLVRRNVLLIGIQDAIHFLQHFHENEAYDEAAILKAAIEAEYRKLIDQGAKGSGVHHSTFIVKAQTIILSEGELKETQIELHEYLNLLKSRISSVDDADDDPESHFPVIKHIRDHCFAWNNAYLLRLYDNHFDIEEMMEVPNIKIDNSWAGLYATSLLIYKKELDNYNLSNYNSFENERRIVQDIEFLVEKYGYVDQSSVRETLILALINNTSKPEMLREIMNEYVKVDQKLEIKNKNGVDFERFQYEKLGIRNNCLGFLDDSDGINLAQKRWLATTWEKDLNNLINEIHFTEGKFLYYKASNQLIEKNTLIKSKLKEIIKNSSFTFDFRSYWESSYLLPEEVFPLLFAKLIELVYEFDHEGFDEYVELLVSKSNDQLGLYTEGFRKSLAKIVHSLLWLGYNHEKIVPIVEIWQAHVLSGVQNRWERTLELLKIYEIYGLLEKDDKAAQVFQEMLNSSMGPSWYKESQVTLINTAMENLKSISDTNIQEFASLLDHASGEMTFQRYVRHNKEDFIGSLIINGKISKAIEYYKFEVLPTPAVLIRNAEISNFDAPRVGDGYCLGARNINEAGSILRVLQTVDCNPYLKWALCQMFTISDDTFRYINSFGEVFGKVLNEIELLNDDNIDSICNITSQLIGSKDIDNDDRRSLLKGIFRNLSSSNALILQKYLQERNLKWNSDSNINENTIGSSKDQKDKFELYNESLAKGPTENNLEKKLSEGLALYDTEKRSIWYNNFSHSLDLAKKNIKSLVLTDNSVIEGLKPQILSFDAEYWDICKELIWFLEGKLTGQQIEEIYRIIGEHFSYIIRPDDEVKQKYSWMNVEGNGLDADSVISELIIWHLNHPDSNIRNKTEEILQFLGSVYPQILEVLFNECISNKPQMSVELSSLILKRISREYSILIKEMLSENRSVLEEASLIPHIVVKKNLLDVGINLNRIGFSDLYENIKNSIPNTVILTGEVYFEEEHLVTIQDYIDDLNSELLLNDEFCKTLNHLVYEYCHPLSKSEVKKSDKYLRRSFYNEEGIPGRYNQLIKHALNNAISSRVARDNISKIFEIINS